MMSRYFGQPGCAKYLLALLGVYLAAGWVVSPFPLPRPSIDLPAKEEESEAAYFQFEYPPYPETFIFELTDPEKIEQARQMLSGQTRSQHIKGSIIKAPAAYNSPWSYHLEPSSIEFFDFAIEVCDASILGVENNLELVCGSFLPDCTWCPWGSRLIVEVIPPAARMYLPFVVKGHP